MNGGIRPAVWSRPRYRASGVKASCSFFCFWDAPPHDATDGLANALMPYEGGPPASIDIDYSSWPTPEAAAAFVARLREGGSFDGLDDATARRLIGAPHVGSLEVTAESPTDLGYLQAAWALAAHAVDRGAIAIKDVDAERWWTADQIRSLDPHRRFAPARDVTVAREEVEGMTRFTTRGMLKLGLTDLGLQVSGDERVQAWASYMFEQAIFLGAQGEPFAVGDEHAVEGAWIRVVRDVGSAEQPLRLLELAQRSLHQASPARGEVPEWVTATFAAAGFAPLDVTDAELAAATPSTSGVGGSATAASTSDPRASWAALERTIGAHGYDQIQVQPTATGALIVIVGRSRAGAYPRGFLFVLSKAEAFPTRPALDPLKARLGPGRTLVLVDVLA